VRELDDTKHTTDLAAMNAAEVAGKPGNVTFCFREFPVDEVVTAAEIAQKLEKVALCLQQ
jgi:hypothetical protein